MHDEEHVDGCELDFKEDPTPDDALADLLVPEGDEEEERDEDEAPEAPGSPDRGIATRLRAAGLVVREVDGWKTRGREFAGMPVTFTPKGSVNHHTAGAPPSAGNAPSLGVVTFGRGGSDPVPGPLCHVLQGYDDTAYVVAAGVANHAGLPDGGVCRGMRGNSDAYGLEVEHPGTSLLPASRVRTAARIHAALLWRPNAPDIEARQVVQHLEWAPSRKIDLATNFRTVAARDQFRAMVAEELRRLNRVTHWGIEYRGSGGDVVRIIRTDPAAWLQTAAGKGALQRARVIIRPRR